MRRVSGSGVLVPLSAIPLRTSSLPALCLVSSLALSPTCLVDAFEPVEVAVDSGPERGSEPGGTETGGAEPGGAVTRGAAPLGTGAAGAPGGAAGGTASTAGGPGGPGGAAGAAGGTGAAGAPGGAAGAGTTGGAPSAAGVGAAAGGSGAVSAGSGGTSRPRPYFVPLLQQVLGRFPPPCPAPSLGCPSPVRLQSLLQPTSPLPGPSPYSGLTGGLTERREPESRPVSPESHSASPVRAVHPGRRVLRQRPSAVPGTHPMLLRLSTAPRRVSLPSPPASSLPALVDSESDSLRAASPTVARLLSTVVTDPSFESAAASALVTELVDFAAHCRLNYAAGLVAQSASICPPSVGGECALGTDVLEDRQEEFECFAAAVPHLVSMLIAPEGDPDAPDIPTPRSYAEAIAGEYSSQWQSAMDAEMASWKSTGTYVDEVPPPWANIVSGMWIFRVKRPPGSPPVFKAWAAPHSSQFPLTEAPLQTLHMDVWGPARVRGQGHERYFLLVVDDYSRYTSVFPLRSKDDVTEVLIDWIRAARLQLRQSLGSDFPVLRLHSDRGGEFSSGLLSAYCRAQGIRQTFTLPDSPQQNGIAERRIGMVMDVARTSMMHAAAPHFLWPFAVRYAAHQINLHPRVSRPETSPALLWTGKVGDASAFRDVTFDESVPYYRLFPYRTAPLPPPPLFLAPGPPLVDPLPPQGPAPSGVSQVDAVEPVEVTGDSGAAGGAEPGGAAAGGAEPGGAASGGAEPRGAELGGTLLGGAEPGGASPGCAAPGGAELRGAPPGGSPGASSLCEPLSPQELREWFSRRWRRAARAGGSSATEGAAVTGPGGARTVSTRAAGPASSTGAGAAEGVGTETTAGCPAGGPPGAAGGSGATGGAAGEGAPAGGTGAVPAVSGVAARPRPYFVPLLEQVLGSPPSTGLPPSLACPQPVQSQLQLQPTSPLPAPSPYTGPTEGLAERGEPASRPASPVRAARTSGRGSRQRPPPVPGTHRMSLRPSTAPLRVPLPSPSESSLPALADPESDSLRAASPTVTRLLATVVTDPSFESTAASALVTELVDFAASCRLDYAASLVAESESVCPPTVGGECALGTDVVEDRQEEFQGDRGSLLFSMAWQAPMDAEMASWKSTGTYVDAVPPLGANIVSGMWIFRVKRPPDSPPVFKARYVARGFSQRQGVDYFQTFSPTPKMTTLRVLLHVAAHRDYELHSLDFSTAFLQGSLHEEIWLRRPLGFTGTFPPGTQWSLRRPVYGLLQAPPSRPSTRSLRGHVGTGGASRVGVLTSALVFFSFMRSPVVLTGHADASWADDQATQRSSQGYTFSLGSGSVSWRATCSSSVLGSSCEAEIYAGAMAAQELRWLTYLLTDLGEPPRSPHVLYVDNKAMLALCREQRLEHRTKHIALRYFLARELQ
ncbi:unnamed protein product [Closterium sp. NIES-54]